MAYIGRGLDNGVRNQFVYAATQGQTAFTGADSDGKTLAMTDILYTDCYQNGVKLKPTTDYTVSSTTLTLITAASLNDVVDIVAFDIFGVPDTVPASTGGTFSGGISATTGTFTGNLASTSSGVITNSLITSSTNQYAEQLFQDGNAGYALQVRSDNAQSTGTGSFLLNDRDTGSFPVVIKEGNASNTLVLSGSKVGIGTTSPDHALVVRRTDGDSKVLELSTGDSTATMNFSRDGNPTAFIKMFEDGSVGTGALIFGTGSSASPAEHMRIASDGDVSIGGTTATAAFNLVGTGGSNVQIQNNIAPGTNTFVSIGFINDNGLIGSIQCGGSSTSYATSSDYRMKENVDYTWDATTRLKQLKPARFNFISDDTNTLVDGFLAHEVSSVVPEAIGGVKDAMAVETRYTADDVETQGDTPSKNVGDPKTYSSSKIDPQSIDQSKLVPLLVKALQEQQTVIESLTTRIAALEAE